MDKVRQLPTSETIQVEASEWIMRLQNEQVSSEDLHLFERWKTAHPRHEAAYDDLIATWDELRHSARIARAVSVGNAINAAGIWSGQPVLSKARKRMKFLGLSAAAAVAAAAVATVWWLGHLANDTRFQTAIGEHASVELPDGSRLQLNSNSLAQVEYSAQDRVVRLSRGEAFFEVAHESGRPFWVVAGDSWIRAVGTAFSVDLRPAGVRVLVSEGSVKVGTVRTGDEVPRETAMAMSSVSLLSAGQKAEMKNGSAEIRPVKPLELRQLAAWREGMLYFEDQSLESVVQEVSRYTSLQIEVDDPTIGQLLIGGMFEANAQGAESLFSMLREGFGLSVRRDGKQILIGK